MSDTTRKEPSENTGSDSVAQNEPKRPYVRPDWEVEEVFEKAALACCKADDGCAFAGEFS